MLKANNVIIYYQNEDCFSLNSRVFCRFTVTHGKNKD